MTMQIENFFKRNQMFRCGALLAGVLLLGAGTVEGAEESTAPVSVTQISDDWQFSTTLYGWMPSIKGESRKGPNLDISFSEILDHLDGIIMVEGGARKGKWSVFGDLIYMDLEDSATARGTGPLGEEEIKLDLDLTMKSWISTMGAGYTVFYNDDFRVNILAGARYLYLDIDLDVDTEVEGTPIEEDHSIKGSQHAWNGIVGLSGTVQFPKQWFGAYYLDVGTGESQLTYQGMGAVGYRYKRIAVVGGYRYLRWNFDQDDDFGRAMNNLKVAGPFMALNYSF